MLAITEAMVFKISTGKGFGKFRCWQLLGVPLITVHWMLWLVCSNKETGQNKISRGTWKKVNYCSNSLTSTNEYS